MVWSISTPVPGLPPRRCSAASLLAYLDVPGGRHCRPKIEPNPDRLAVQSLRCLRSRPGEALISRTRAGGCGRGTLSLGDEPERARQAQDPHRRPKAAPRAGGVGHTGERIVNLRALGYRSSRRAEGRAASGNGF